MAQDVERMAREQAEIAAQLDADKRRRAQSQFTGSQFTGISSPQTQTSKPMETSMTSSERRRLGLRERDLPRIRTVTCRNRDAVISEITGYIRNLRMTTKDDERVNVARNHLLQDFNAAVDPKLKKAPNILAQARNKINGAARRTQRRQPDHS
jgi:hypothetical protein